MIDNVAYSMASLGTSLYRLQGQTYTTKSRSGLHKDSISYLDYGSDSYLS
jgi:hypothetical protein